MNEMRNDSVLVVTTALYDSIFPALFPTSLMIIPLIFSLYGWKLTPTMTSKLLTLADLLFSRGIVARVSLHSFYSFPCFDEGRGVTEKLFERNRRNEKCWTVRFPRLTPTHILRYGCCCTSFLSRWFYTGTNVHTKTTKAPSSWAIVSGWKKYIDGTDEETEQEQQEQECDHNKDLRPRPVYAADDIDDSNHVHANATVPITDETARLELKEFGREYYRNIVFRNNMNNNSSSAGGESSSMTTSSLSSRVVAGTTSASTHENEPDLRIPVGGEFIHLAQ